MRLTICTVAAAAAALSLAATPTRASPHSPHCQPSRDAIRFYVAATHRWELEQGSWPAGEARALHSPSCRYLHWAALRWQHRARAARRSFTRWFAGETKRWACIHHAEGRWDDHGLPQMGGLQMDPQFQLDYGSEFVRRWGDAGYWPIWAQYVAAERAFHGYQSPYKGSYIGARGFGPWTTAPGCQ